MAQNARQDYKQQKEYWLYLAGLVFAGIVLLAGFFFLLTPWQVTDMVWGCYIRKATGFYCPGCGGTRAVRAFLQGRWVLSAYYHPFVPYCGILYLVFMIRGTLCMLTRGKSPWMIFRYGYLCGGAVLLVLQFAVKNILLWKGLLPY